MPGISVSRRKVKEAAAKREEAKRHHRNNVPSINEVEIVETTNKDTKKPILKAVRKKFCDDEKVIATRSKAKVNEIKEKQKEEKRPQPALQKRAELRENAKKIAEKRRGIMEKMNQNIKVRKLEQENQQLKEAILSSETSKNCFEPLSIITDDPQSSKSMPNSPTGIFVFDFPRPQSAPPSAKLQVQASTRIKNVVGLSTGGYEKLRNEMAKEGIKMPSPSTIKRKENRIFDDHYQSTDKPDFYGLIQTAAMKHDFSQFSHVRITVGGDGGGDGKKASVKIGCFFNDVELPLSVKKYMIIWTYVGKESWVLLEPILKQIDADILKLMQNGVMTKSGLKPVIITYIGDCKFQCLSLSLQGGSSICGCPQCITKRSEWATIKAEDIVLRTIEMIMQNAEEVIQNKGKPILNASVYNFPLLRNIPITHFVPPVVHILICLVNSIIELIRKFGSDNDRSELEDFLAKTGAKLHFPAKCYEGNMCRKILTYFNEENPKILNYDGYGADLFKAASKIESYSVARTLTDEEINAMESYIHLFFNQLKEYGQPAFKFLLNKNKIHMLKEHVIPFVKLFKSWGLFSEQSVESIHHIRNDLDNRIPGDGPEVDEKRNNYFKKNQAVAFHFS